MRLMRFPSWAKSVTAVTVSVAAAQLPSEQGIGTRSTWHAERAMSGGPGNCLSKMNRNTESNKKYPNSYQSHPTQILYIPGHTPVEFREVLHEDGCNWLSLPSFSIFFFFPPTVDNLLKLIGAFLSMGANISGMTVLSLWVHAQEMKMSCFCDKERDETVFLENIYLSLALL